MSWRSWTRSARDSTGLEVIAATTGGSEWPMVDKGARQAGRAWLYIWVRVKGEDGPG